MRVSFGFIGLVVVLTCTVNGYAATLRVSPAQFTLHDVEPGKLYDLYAETGLRLSIFNDDDTAHTWAVSTHRPSERGRWETGYGEIPDASWCWFDRSSVEVPANDRGYAHLFVRIPDEEQYYNQHWIVTLAVEGARRGLGVSLAVDVRVQIETKAKRGLSGPPHGSLGMEPSVVEFADVAPGAELQQRVMLYNNDSANRTYTVGSLFLDPKHEPKTYLTRSYDLLPERAWIAHETSLDIAAGESVPLILNVRIPGGDNYVGKKWEEIVLIQPDAGRAEFVRVRIETALPNAAGDAGEEAP